MKMNILIVGVGGQGTLLASRVFGKYAERCGLDCELSEVHGMAQRGGSVVTHVKIDKKVYSPLVEEGSADVIVSFESLETIRWANYIKPHGYIICNTQQIMPMPVVSGAQQYPSDIIERLNKYSDNVIAFDALALAKEAGSIRAVNTVMLAKLCKVMKLDVAMFLQALTESVPPKTLELNRAAFEAAYNRE